VSETTVSEATVSKVRSALVVGGGLAGPATAMALQLAGVQATIYEARDEGAPIRGGGFNIATNGLDALAALGALDATAGLGLPAPRLSFYGRGGRPLGTVTTGLPAPGGQDTTSFKRRALFGAVQAEAARRGIVTEYGKRLTGLHQDAGSVTARFGDGTTATADILVGADGIHSAVRLAIDPAAPAPRYTGLLSFGGFAPNPGLPAEPGLWKMAFGRQAFFGWFVPDGSQVWWFVSMPSHEPLTRGQIVAEGMGTWSRRLAGLFEGEHIPAAEIIAAQGEDIVVVGAEHDLPSVPTWHNGRVIIVGDAAHAASTSSGQGAAMALEDAVALGRCLRDCPGPGAAFAAFEQLRRDRVNKVVALGAKTASSKAAGPVGALLRDTMMRIGFRFFYQPESAAWLLRQHTNWDAPVTVPAVRLGEAART
jgi:2-polyprenyl-6-methoxyphenol hydroxylase-like FAD-dependent oxidoreductase